MFAKLLVAAAVATLCLAVPTAEKVQRRQSVRVIERCTVPNTAALTFDDGPYIYGKQIAQLLEKNGVTGTFFYNGDNWACIYEENMMANIKYVYGQGHQVASHTWNHYNLPTLSEQQLHDQFSRSNQALVRITGAYPAFFRPPYGEYNNLVLKVAAFYQQAAVLWDLDSGDSVGKDVEYQEQQYDNAAEAHPSTILSLEHETYNTTAEVAQHAIDKLKAAGYRLVTVAECIGAESPYLNVTAPQTPTSDWKC